MCAWEQALRAAGSASADAMSLRKEFEFFDPVELRDAFEEVDVIVAFDALLALESMRRAGCMDPKRRGGALPPLSCKRISAAAV
eukprot:CAMPEP_0176090448 /NCGR_PEP_ID=MMETSP0120_2-20121206/45298_1 /TAXON_ID=160619 /ORGANISM="Kryptoperidinium foliaceum, Strain CCMP 1326" /LENGTH=83 /DNA_ID=CAMNT_0017424329 /DNA_START=314 /DNA_END=562 /DNA_ORIENTATION=+